MRQLPSLLGLLALIATTSGCLEIEQRVVLRADLSGTAEVVLGVDLKPQITEVARARHGNGNEPTLAEIDAVLQEVVGPWEALLTPEAVAAARARGQKRLPEGIEYRDIKIERQGTKLRITLLFGFDRVEKLAHLELAALPQDRPRGTPTEALFSGFAVKEEGKTLRIVNAASVERPRWPAPLREGEEPAGGLSGGEISFDRYFYRLEAPFRVLQTNATGREGQALVWDLDAKAMAKPPGDLQSEGFWVLYKR